MLALVAVGGLVGGLGLGSGAAAQDGGTTSTSTTTTTGPPAPASTDDDNTGTPVAPASVLGDVTAQATGVVALFFDPAYVDTDTGGGGEAYNMQQTLLTQGFTVNTFIGTSTAAWTAALAGADVVVVPELANDDGLGSDLEPGALAALRSFIAGGKRLIVSSDEDFNFLEVVLELTAGTLTGDQSCPCSITASAAGTEFASGPASLDPFSATNTVALSTLPAGSLNIYADDDDADEAGVARVPYTCGSIVYLGWDWFFGGGSGFDDWFDVLEVAVSGASSSCPEPAPLVARFAG